MLKAHLEECAECRGVFRDSRDLHLLWLPNRRGFEIRRKTAVEMRLRQKILQRVGAAGGNFSELALRSSAPVGMRTAQSRFGRLRYPVVALAAGLLIVLVGASMAVQKTSSALVPVQPPIVTFRPPAPPNLHLLDQELSRDTTWQTEQILQQKLDESRTTVAQLEQLLQAAKRRADHLVGSNSIANLEVADLRHKLGVARGSMSNIKKKLAAAEGARSELNEQLAVSMRENWELHTQLSTESVNLRRERRLLSRGRDIRDLIAARNLHIIDVYDTNGDGRTAKAFGRVFYTEHQSLIFFAYDLPRRSAKSTKYEFTAWGKGDGDNARVHKLGIFYRDTKDQRRWVLEVTNPHVLSTINSVFVTLEKTDRPVNSPSGKKLLSAYLGTPANHP